MCMFIHICKNIDLGFSENVVNPIHIYIYMVPPQHRHFQDCNAFGIVTLFSLRSSGAVSYIYMHIYTHMYIICYLTITKSMYLEYFLQEVFANVCKRLQTFLIRIQDSRFPEKLLESKGIGFKIQDSRFPEKLLESQDSRFKIPRKNSWIQGDRSWILNPGIQEFFLGILNLESYPLGFKNSFWESWILNLSKYLGPWTRLQTFADAFGDKITLSTWVQQ